MQGAAACIIAISAQSARISTVADAGRLGLIGADWRCLHLIGRAGMLATGGAGCGWCPAPMGRTTTPLDAGDAGCSSLHHRNQRSISTHQHCVADAGRLGLIGAVCI